MFLSFSFSFDEFRHQYFQIILFIVLIVLIYIYIYIWQELVDEYGIEAMPTFVLMRSGKELDRVVGTQKDQLLNFIIQHK